MNKKEFLKQYLKYEGLKKDYLNKILRLKTNCEKVTSSLGGVGGKSESLKDDAYADLILEKEKVQKEIEKINKLQQSIEVAVFGLSDGLERRVLELRYFEGYSWVKISLKMSFSRSKVFEIHNQALANL